jgi:hypothetical protein
MKGPALSGTTNFNLTCGKWVIANFAKNDKFAAYNIPNLCTLVNDTNNNSGSRRNLAASASGVTTIPTSSDPTLNDPVAQINTTALSSTTATVTVDGSTSTTASGASDAKIASINQVATSVNPSSAASYEICFIVMIFGFLALI